MEINGAGFGELSDKRRVDYVDLKNSSGVSVRLMTLGASLISLVMPDCRGNPAEVTLGRPDLAGYLRPHPYFGATIGPVANRIAGGRFTLDGREYPLDCNEQGAVHLHGGPEGLHSRLWDPFPMRTARGAGVQFAYTRPDSEAGYPGTMDITVFYELTEDSELTITYEAVTDKPTPVSLTNHTYFNLNGSESGPLEDQTLTLETTDFLETADDGIPTGRILSGAGGPYDFSHPKVLGDFLDQSGGLDLCFLHTGTNSSAPKRFAELAAPATGRRILFYSDQPGFQLYTGKALEGVEGREGTYRSFAGLAVEAQGLPDSVNQAGFPSIILRPGERYRRTVIWKLDWNRS